MNAIDDSAAVKRRIHPLAKWSLGIALGTIPAAFALTVVMPLLVPALIGGGLAVLLGIVGFFAILSSPSRFRGVGLSVIGGMLGLAPVVLIVPLG